MGDPSREHPPGGDSAHEAEEVALDLGLTQDEVVECDKPGWMADVYPDFDPVRSWVVSGPLGDYAKFKGTRYSHWREAEKATNAKFNVIKFWTFGQRWFARVKACVIT